MPKSVLGKTMDIARRRKEIRRAQSDLFFLADKLGYKWNPALQMGVSEEFHRNLCTRMDSLRDHPRVGTFAPRKSQKSTLFTICLVVQEIIRNPDVTILITHAVSEEAEAFVKEIGGIFKENEWLRSLDPIGIYPPGHPQAGKSYRLCPDKRRKKWLLNDRFTIDARPGMSPTTRRQPTVKAKGAGSEITGTHVDLIFLDDIIGLSTIEDSTGMARIRKWWKATTLNVLNTGGRVRLVGTRWDEADVYDDFIKSNEWDIVVRHARENEAGQMDYKGRAVVYGPALRKNGQLSVKLGRRLADRRERQELAEMGAADYAAQRMNDPAPAGSIPWVKENEQFCRWEDQPGMPGAKGPGQKFVLFDPAPRAGSSAGGGVKEKQRGDGSKDWGSIAVVKLKAIGSKQCIFLLDGARSQDWNRIDGLEQARIMMEKWQTPYFFIENYTGGTGDCTMEMRTLCNAAGTSLYLDDGLLPKFNQSYAFRAKTGRIEALAAKNDRQEFYICEETCPEEYLYGDGQNTGFLTQIRRLRPLPGGNNNLKWDDDADIVSRATDSKLARLAPIPDPQQEWQRRIEQMAMRSRKMHSRVRHMTL